MVFMVILVIMAIMVKMIFMPRLFCNEQINYFIRMVWTSHPERGGGKAKMISRIAYDTQQEKLKPFSKISVGIIVMYVFVLMLILESLCFFS
jgi:hypothetical protein